MVYEWGLKDVPALKDEAYMTTRKDYIMRIHFQLAAYYTFSRMKIEVASTWQKLSHELLKEDRFGQFLDAKKKALEQEIELMPLPPKLSAEGAFQLVQHVKENYHWNGYKGLNPSQRKAEFLKSKTGNVSDINLTLVGLLRAAGFDAEPVLLSTRGHGMVYYNYPFLNNFNYVAAVVHVDGQNIPLDATEPLLSNKILPSRCLNGYGLGVAKTKKDEEVDWYNLEPLFITSHKSTLILKPNEEQDKWEGNYIMDLTGYDAFKYRSKFKEGGAKALPELLIEEFDGVEFKNITPKGINQVNNKLRVTSEIQLPMEQMDDMVFISPLLFDGWYDHDLTEAQRTYPVDFNYRRIVDNRSIINIPEGYQIEFLPESKTIKDENNKYVFTYLVQQAGSNIQVMNQIKINSKRIAPNDYKKLRAFFDAIVKKHTEKIVLTKI